MLLLWEKRRFIAPILIIIIMSFVSVAYNVRESRHANDAIIATSVAIRSGIVIDESSDAAVRKHVRYIQMPAGGTKSTLMNNLNETETKLKLLLTDTVSTSTTSEKIDSDDRNEDATSYRSETIEKPSNSTEDIDSDDRDMDTSSDQSETMVTLLNVENDEHVDDSSANDTTNKTVISWVGVDGMRSIINRYWKGNLFCETIDRTRSEAGDPDLPIVANLSFSCKELFEKSECGTGNFIALFYGIRLAAHMYGNVDVYITCDDANVTKNDLILPWITGWFPARPLTQERKFPITVKEACGNYDTQPLAYMYEEIQHDFRRMAIGLMGIPNSDHASATFAEEYLWSENTPFSSTGGHLTLNNPQRYDKPPFPASEYGIDDALLHFRCGDLMDSTHSSFAFMKFSGYTRHISPNAKTIGILTQPFEADTQSRKEDSGQHKRDRCRTVVYSLVEYIKIHYPEADVRIHNEAGETIALTFARMILSNQTIAGISSFGVIPAVSTFGTGYIRYPDYRNAPNQWLIKPRIDGLATNIILFYEPKRIMVGQMKGLWQSEGEAGVLEWFWNDTLPP